MEQKEILNTLVSDYNEGKLSALVGAGFSKNVSNRYLNWNELLIDMYKEVYSEEIEQSYQNYLHYNKDSSSAVSSEADAKKNYIKSRLKNEDLLALVSKYIKKAWRSYLLPVPRLEAFALPIVVKRATRNPRR